VTIAIVGLIALIGLVAAGLFLPLLLVPAAVLAVLWVVYVVRAARAGGDPERV